VYASKSIREERGSRYDQASLNEGRQQMTPAPWDAVASKLAHKLGLRQSPGKDVMQKFASRVRELQGQGRTVDQAAPMAAAEIFPAEFQASRYAGGRGSMEDILTEIEKL
jgi:hypothetical protein